MANLIDTIQSFGHFATLDQSNKITMMFITNGGVIFGTPTTVDVENEKFDPNEDPTKFFYSQSFKLTDERGELGDTDLDLKETILLENVSAKLGKVTLNVKYLILNTSQVSAFQLVTIDSVEELLQGI